MKNSNLIDTFSGISPLGPSRKVKAAIRKAAKKIAIYPEEEISRLERFFFSKYGIPSERLHFSTSSTGLLHSILRTFDPVRVLIVGPVDRLHQNILTGTVPKSKIIIPAEEDDFAPNINIIKKEIEECDLMFVSNPNRITGRVIDRKNIHEIINSASKHNALIIFDETLIDFTEENGALNDALKYENVTVIRTTANFYGMAGLELAYAVSSNPVISSLRHSDKCGLNMLTVEAARTAFKDKSYTRALKKYLLAEKRLFINSIKKINYLKLFKSDSNIMLIKSDKDITGLVDKLKYSGFDIRDCGEITGMDKKYLSIAIMRHEQNLKFLRVLKTYT